MSAADYIEYVYLETLVSSDFDERVGDKWIKSDAMWLMFRSALYDTLKNYGYNTAKNYDELIQMHYDGINKSQGILFEGDEYTGSYARLNIQNKDAYVKSKIAANPATKRLNRLGTEALTRALDAIAIEEDWIRVEVDVLGDQRMDDSLENENILIPAADRVVSIGHNQAAPLIEATEELIDKVETTTNAFDGDVGLRARILGQLKAARELLVAGVFKVQAIQSTLVEALEFLAKRYEKEIIGGLAAALLAEILRVIVGA